MRSRHLVAVLATIALVGCGDAAADQPAAEAPSPPPYDVAITIPEADAGEVAADTIVEIVYPGGEMRGIVHSLQRWDGTTWTDTYWVGVSDPDQPVDEGRIRNAWAPASEEYPAESMGFTGSEGGQYTVIPSPTEPGTYRICTARAATTLCSAAFEVTRH